MAKNRFHQYVSNIRKSKTFKPVLVNMGFEKYVVVAENKHLGPVIGFGGNRIQEFTGIVGGLENVMVIERGGYVHLGHLWLM